MKKYLLAICILVLASCTGQQESSVPKMTGISMPLDLMNREIRLSQAPGMMDTFKFMGILNLNLDNLSDNPITFPSDFGTKIFIKQNNDWIPIQNTFGYSDAENVLPAQKDYLPGIIVAVTPLLPSSSTSGTIRIIVTGNVQGTGKAVGAYIDVNLGQ